MNLLESIDLKWKCIEEKNEQACWRTITVNEKNQSGTMICSDETEDSLVSLFKMISENDMRTFMEEQGESQTKKLNSYQLVIRCFLEILKMNNVKFVQSYSSSESSPSRHQVSPDVPRLPPPLALPPSISTSSTNLDQKPNDFEVIKLENQAELEDEGEITSSQDDSMHITNDLIQYPTLATANLVSNLINSAKNQIQVGHKRPRSAEKQTRNRTHYNFKQIAVLEEIFEKHLFCPQAERKKVAQILGLTELNVKHWFKNRRAKFRRTDGWEARSQMNDEETAPEYVLSVLRNHYPEQFLTEPALPTNQLNGLSSLINHVKQTNEHFVLQFNQK